MPRRAAPPPPAATRPPGAAFSTYTLPGRAVAGDAQAENEALKLRVQLLERKVELLNRKVAQLGPGRTTPPDTHQLDLDLTALDAQLQGK